MQDSNPSTLKRALVAVNDLTSRLEAAERSRREPIAIIGMGCRFPGADDPDSFWRLLENGVDAIREVPASRWNIDAFYDPDPDAPGRMYTRSGGFLDRIDEFDPQFFGIAPREAVGMDPQQRLLLEVAWEALENAGIAPDSLAHTRTGVFVGITANDYLQLGMRRLDEVDAYRMTGGCLNFASGRLAHILGLRGPCLAIDTACASSLTAVHLACQSLRSSECAVAMAGGVNVILSPDFTVLVSKTRALSRDGRCKAFDASADGMGRGEGCGVVILKRLSDAVRDGDRVLAVIRGSAVSHDGKSSGFTVPTPRSQEDLIREALRNAGVAASEIGYVEAHGTGTALGDPIEMEALAAVFGDSRAAQQLAIGSVKTNIGHSESAAGVAGLIKLVLSIQHRMIPPHLHFRTPSPHIPWHKLPFVIPTQLTPWHCAEGSRRTGGVSSFGMSGTIAHLIVEEASPAKRTEDAGSRPRHLLTISAQTEHALRAVARRFETHIGTREDQSLADICFTANTGRAHFPYRAALVFGSRTDACEGLRAVADGTAEAAVAHVTRPKKLDGDDLATGDDLERLAALYLRGVDLNGTTGDRDASLQKVALPTYPFERQRYWLAGHPERAHQPAETRPRTLLGRRFDSPVVTDVIYQSEWDVNEPALLAQHRVYGTVVVAGTMFVEMALAGAANEWGPGEYVLENFSILAALVLDDDTVRQVQLIMRPDEASRYSFEIYSKDTHDPGGSWSLHASGKIGRPHVAIRSDSARTLDAAQLRCVEEVSTRHFYETLQARGLEYGPDFATIQRLWRGPGEAVGMVALPNTEEAGAAFVFHPGVLDGCLQVVGAAAAEILDQPGDAFLITGFHRMHIHEPVSGPLSCNGFLHPNHSGSTLTADVFIHDADGRRIAEVAGISFKRVPAKMFERFARRKAADGAGLSAIGWQPQARHAEQPGRLTAGRWLVVSDRRGVGARLNALMQQRGASSSVVFADQPPTEIRRALQGLTPTDVVYLGSLDASFDPAMPAADLAANHARGTGGLLSLAQTILAGRSAQPPVLWIGTERAQSIAASEAPAIEQSTVWGLARVIRIEHPELSCISLDLDRADAAAQADLLLEELQSGGDEDQVALRDAARYVARLKPIVVRNATAGVIRGEATYLVTGGMGGLGLRVAEWLVQKGARSLVLMGRSAPPADAEKVIARLEAAGATIVVRRADIANVEDVRLLIDEISTAMPRLAGVIHAAGVLDDGVVLSQTWPRFATVLAPKAGGAWNLHLLTKHAPLDFFIMFSSAVSILGAAGQSNYAAGNAFMDALAHYRRSLDLPALSINWPPWTGTGMAAAASAAVENRWKEWGARLAPQEGLAILERLLGAQEPQIAVLPIKWERYVEHLAAGRDTPFFAEVLRDADASSEAAARTREKNALQTRLQSSPPNHAREIVFHYVRQQVSGVLGLEPEAPINEQQPLNELGLDSLMAVELRNTLGASVGRTLSAGLIYLYPTILALSEYLASDILQLPATAKPTTDVEAADAAEALLLDEIEQLSDDELDEKMAALADLHLVGHVRRSLE